MLIYRPHELVILADAYCKATGKHKTALIGELGVNDKLFRRLAAGLGCHSDTLIQASTWFITNWPDEAEWPAQIKRPRPSMAA